MIAGSDLVAMMGLPALIGGPMGALAGLAVGIIGTYLPQIISSFKNAVPGIVAEINGWISSIIDTFSTTDFAKVGEDVGHSIFTSISNLTSDAATALVNLFSGIDYTRVGIALYDILVAAWDFAWGTLANAGTWIQKWLDSSNFDLTGIFTGPLSALEGIFGPTFNHLENAAIDAWNVIGEGAVTLENAIGGGITGAIRTVISAFADLAGAADEALGGAIGKALGLTDAMNGTTDKTATPSSGSSDTGSTDSGNVQSVDLGVGQTTNANNEAIRMGLDPNGMYTDTKTGFTTTGADFASRGNRGGSLVRAGTGGSSSGGSDSGSPTGTYEAAQTSLSNPSTLASNFVSASANSVDKGGTGETGWQTLDNIKAFFSNQYTAWNDRRVGFDQTYANENSKPMTPTEVKLDQGSANNFIQNAENTLWTGMIAKEGNLPGITATNQKAAADIALIPEGQQTSTQKAIAAGIANTDTLHTDLGIVATKLEDNGTKGPELTGNAVHDAIEKWGADLAYKDATWTDIKHVDETAAADAKAAAQDTKDGLAGLDGDMQRQIDAMNNAALKFPDATDAAATKVADATKTAAATYTPSMFYGGSGSSTNTNTEGGYVGPTVNYPAYRDQIDAQKADAQAINEKYGITSVGNISMKIDADTTQAEAKKATLESDITAAKPTVKLDADTTQATAKKSTLENDVTAAKPTLTISATTSQAMDDINKLITWVINSRPVMTVQVQVTASADEIQAQVEAAIRAALA
jgi:hypothetical protein